VSAAWSPEFLHALADEFERVQRALDKLDGRMESLTQQAAKDRVSAERRELIEYQKFLRRVLRH
jgi:hypothetical protein